MQNENKCSFCILRFAFCIYEGCNMNYRRLGGSGIKLSEIGLGGWLTFGNALAMEQAKAVMTTAFDVGINFFDTADAYANGECERAWGLLLADHRRASYVLATKVFFPTGPGPNDRGLSRKHIVENCHRSLSYLKTDYLDLLQCHRFDAETPIEETIRAMDDLVRQGKILYWGFSEWTAEQIEQCLRACGDRFERPRSSQPRYSAVQREVEKEVFPLCQTAGIGQVVFSPLAQGVLSGKYKPGQPVPADSRAADDRQNQFIQRFISDQALLEKIQHLEGIAKANNCTMSQLALAWALRRSEVTTCIVGASRPAQLEENAKASGIKLTDAVVAKVDEILA
jgi:aryl-alcohol dehydrogenase-like predicted oxidoreductase